MAPTQGFPPWGDMENDNQGCLLELLSSIAGLYSVSIPCAVWDYLGNDCEYDATKKE